MRVSLQRLSISNEVANHPIRRNYHCEPVDRRMGPQRAKLGIHAVETGGEEAEDAAAVGRCFLHSFYSKHFSIYFLFYLSPHPLLCFFCFVFCCFRLLSPLHPINTIPFRWPLANVLLSHFSTHREKNAQRDNEIFKKNVGGHHYLGVHIIIVVVYTDVNRHERWMVKKWKREREMKGRECLKKSVKACCCIHREGRPLAILSCCVWSVEDTLQGSTVPAAHPALSSDHNEKHSCFF